MGEREREANQILCVIRPDEPLLYWLNVKKARRVQRGAER